MTDHLSCFPLTGSLHTAVFADTIEAPYLRITAEQYANIGEKDTLFKDREHPKTIPYSAARTYIAHVGEYSPRAFAASVCRNN